MNAEPWILISIAAIMILLLIVFLVKKVKNKKPLTPLSSFAFGFVIAGIVFGDNKILSYCLMGVGIILAVVDIILKKKNKTKQKRK